ncbi:MAG: preprotein translocase subunit SecE [Bacteroidetes bacterium]|nr:preprotein translocase subunit SecE [Bacteroidota bacterium]MBX7045522.1 preprotein translocase subunit SecE [Ignavibacteria bacterium]
MKEKIVGFFDDMLKEMKKVSWPKKTELRGSTIITLVTMVISAAFVYGIDKLISWVLMLIFGGSSTTTPPQQ